MTNSRKFFSCFEVAIIAAIITILVLLLEFSRMPDCGGIHRQTSITLELQLMGGAIEDFRTEYGVYPPNLMPNSLSDSSASPAQDILVMFKKAFPRNNEPESLLLALAGGEDASSSTSTLPGGLTASEAIHFWLGGFSLDPQYPLSGIGGASFSDSEGDGDGTLDSDDEKIADRNSRYEFDIRRLGPRDTNDNFDDSGLAHGGGRFIEYDDPRTGERRRINFWQYFPSGSTLAFVYFDVSRHTPIEYYPAKSEYKQEDCAPFMEIHLINKSTFFIRGRKQFVEQGKFQLLHAGTDNKWGDFSGIRSGDIVVPKGPYPRNLEDTLANFMPGTLEDKQE